MKEETNKKKKIIICVIAVILIAVALIVFLYFKSQIRATTMRILRLEGEVTLTDDGKEKTVRENIRLNDGNALSTAVQSLVSIGLDDTKIVTLDEMSRAEFNQSGRMLDLKLTDGSLFFEVQKPLDDDETMDIRTSTMVVGIRGTSGWVSVEGDHESLIVTDGHVHVTGINPTTGETKEIEVYAGQRIQTYLYNDRNVDSIMFYVEDVTEHDLPEFLLERLRENPELLDKVCKETGWDKPWILGVREEEIPKTIEDSGDSDDDNGSSSVTEADTELPDTGEEETEENEDTKTDGPLTKEELAWAHSHIAVTDPATGIMALKDMTLFDPVFYAVTNPDVVAAYGTDPDALLYHYLKRGKKEGRPPIAPPTPTPTPTPTWEETKSESHEEEPTPTSAPVSQVPVVVTHKSSIQGVNTISNTGGSGISQTFTINSGGGKTANGNWNQFAYPHIEITSGSADITLPLNITTINGGTDSENDFDNNSIRLTSTDPNDIVRIIKPVFNTGTDVVKTQTGGTPVQESYSYGDSNVQYNGIDEYYMGNDGNHYIRLTGSNTAYDAYINKADGSVTVTNTPP